MALGKGSITVPSTSMASSLGIYLIFIVISRSYSRIIHYPHKIKGSPPPLQAAQDQRSLSGYRHGVLKMGGTGAVLGHRSPAVLQDAHLPGPHGGHGFDGQGHARLQPRPPSR